MIALYPFREPTPFYSLSYAQKMAQEKAAEEQKIRKDFEEQLSTLEATARAEFERDLEAKLAAEKRTFEAELTAEATRADIERQMAGVEATERAKFEAELAAKKEAMQKSYLARVKATKKAFEKQMGAEIVKAKREYAMQQRKQLPPRAIRTYRETQREILKQAVAAEVEVFEEEVRAWEQRAVGEWETGVEEWKAKELVGWETGERERLKTELETAEEEARESFEAQIKTWKKEQRAEILEPAIAEWEKEWKPKGLAERIFEFEPVEWAADIFGLKGEKREKYVAKVKPVLELVTPEVPPFKEPTKALAGIVAAPEAFVYGIAGLAGIKTPRIPVTFTGGVISSAIGLKPSPQLKELEEKGASYLMGSILGEALLSYGIGKAAQKLVVEPISKTAPARALGEAFRAKAPKLALRVVYGKKGAEAIVLERKIRAIESTFGAWEPLPEALIGAKKVAQEITYGMPFYRAETLHIPMPTLEMQRLRYAEWFAPRAAIEAQLGWELGVAPAYGIPAAAAKPIGIGEMMEQAEKVTMPVMMPEKEIRLALVGEELKEQLVTKAVQVGWKETAWTYRGAFEFEQATKMMLPSRLFVPKVPEEAVGEAFFRVTRGVRTTPFETTLGKAIMGERALRLGGLTALQLAPEVLKEFPVAPSTAATVPKAPVRVAVREVGAEIFKGAAMKPAAKVAVDLGAALGIGAATLPYVAEIPTVAEKQISMQAVKQGLKTVQVQIQGLKSLQIGAMEPTPQKAPEVPAVPWQPSKILLQPPKLPPRKQEEKKKLLRKKKRKAVPWELRAAFFEYPVRREKDVPSFIFEGLGKTTKRKGEVMNLSKAIFSKKKRKKRGK